MCDCGFGIEYELSTLRTRINNVVDRIEKLTAELEETDELLDEQVGSQLAVHKFITMVARRLSAVEERFAGAPTAVEAQASSG